LAERVGFRPSRGSRRDSARIPLSPNPSQRSGFGSSGLQVSGNSLRWLLSARIHTEGLDF
jgi:hypothetical protein